jgi:hypothetical protein
MRPKLLPWVLGVQGAYYALTGLWALVSLESFSRVTGHAGDPFEMHSIAAMALVLGLFFVWSARHAALRRPVGALALGIAVAVLVPELIYLPRIGNPVLFWVDFAEETVVALVLAVILLPPPRR